MTAHACWHLTHRPHRIFGIGSVLALGLGLWACSSEPEAPQSLDNSSGVVGSTDSTATSTEGSTSGASSASATTGPGTTGGSATAGTLTTGSAVTSSTGSGGAGTTASSATNTTSTTGVGGATTSTVSTTGTMSGAGGASNSGETTTGGMSADAEPSAGCGMGSGTPQTLNVANEYIVTFPPSYDGSTPIGLVFGFHGAGRSNQQFREVDARTQDTELEATYIMAYPKSSGNDWTGQLSTNLSRFDSLYDTLLADYCVDTNRVFVTGHSSGAGFTSELVCQRGDRLRAAAPVAAWEVGQNCSAIPVMIIHGAMDSERGNDGSGYVALYRSWNGCGSGTSTYDVATCQSSNTTVNPNCVEYDGCSEATIWCSHNDPNYSNTNHGWPCFANDAIFDFFQSLG